MKTEKYQITDKDGNEVLAAIVGNTVLADGWIPVTSIKPPYNTRVLAAFKTVTGNTVECVAQLVLVQRHCFENPPMDETWFVYPTVGHRIEPEYWMPYGCPPPCR